MLVVIIAIGTTDLLFALDSIPAVFGLTQQPFLVFAVNAFALMGLRQLYFLIGGLLDRLVYLPIGLAVLLLFIGAKLILEVLHTDSLPFVPGAQKVSVPVIGTGISLAVVVGVLAITVRGQPAQEPARSPATQRDLTSTVAGRARVWWRRCVQRILRSSCNPACPPCTMTCCSPPSPHRTR